MHIFILASKNVISIAEKNLYLRVCRKDKESVSFVAPAIKETQSFIYGEMCCIVFGILVPEKALAFDRTL